jgi:hypothetical protein
MAHYRLTRETKRIGNKVVYRIQATAPIEEFGVGAGELGGWIEGEHNLSQDGLAWVAGEAIVMDQAVVTDDALVTEQAFIDGMAKISGSARVYGEAQVSDAVIITGNARVGMEVDLGGRFYVYGNALIEGNLTSDLSIKVGGNAVIGSSDDFLYLRGPYSVTVYRTADGGMEGLPPRIPEPLQGLFDEWFERLGLTPTEV